MNAKGKKLCIAAAVTLAAAALGAPIAARASARSVASVPGPPSGVVVLARDQGALVSWQPPSSNGGSPVTGYVIKASPGGRSVQTLAVTSFLVGGLKNGTAYTFTVAAVNKDGTGPASSPSAAVTPHAPTGPGSPRSVVAAAGFRQVSVSWAAPKSDGGAPITAYRLSTSPATPTRSVAGDARSATLTGLTDGKAYRVTVAAVNSVGRGKAVASASVTPHVTVPGIPAGVTAAPASSGLRVSWQPPVSNGGSAVTAYVITVAGTSRKITAKGSARSVTITGLAKGKSYIFAVAARNAKGTGHPVTSAPATGGAVAGAGVVVLSKASLAALTTAQTGGSLVFASPPLQVQNIVAGDIVVAGVSPATPQGFLGQVTSVSAFGSTVTLATVPASLDQAFSSAGFGIKAALGRGQVTSFTPARTGVRLLPAAGSTADCPSPDISLSLKTTLYKDSNGRMITADGSVCVSPSVSFSASVTCCFHVSSSFTGTVTAAASVDITAQLSHDFSTGYTLGYLTFDPIVVDVAGVPIVIVPTLSVKVVGHGSVSAGLTAGVGESVTLGANVTTNDAHVHARPIYSRTTTFTPPTLFGSASAAVGVQANLSTKIDGLTGPTLTDTLWLAELTVDPSATPWWTLDLENILDVHYKLTILDHKLAEFQATLSDSKIPLAHATSPYQGITITPNPAAVAPGGQLQLQAQVAGAADQQVTWNAPPGNGSISASGLYTAPATPGFYQVTAAQAASGLDPGATGLTTIQVGAQPPGPPTSATATSASYGSADVTWSPPADTGGSPITGYTITAQPGGSQYTVAGTATSDTISALTPGATYTFTVTATSGGGTSIPSAPTSPLVIDDVSGVLSSFTPSPSGNGRAMAFDPATGHLFYTLSGDTNIYVADTSGNAVTTLNTGVNFGALAWDPKDGLLWGGAYDGTGDVYTIDPVTGATTLQFTFNFPAGDSCYNQVNGYIDGLAYDSSDGSLWLSDDAGTILFHVDTSGNVLGSWTVPNSKCNTGIAVANGVVWLAYQEPTTDQPPFGFMAVSAADPTTVLADIPYSGAHEAEGIAFDATTFAPTCALWSDEAGSTLIVATALPTCTAAGLAATPAARRFTGLKRVASIPPGKGLGRSGPGAATWRGTTSACLTMAGHGLPDRLRVHVVC